MDSLAYARAQMGMSLAFHIVFAAAGVALPLLMVIADAMWLRTRDVTYRELSLRLAKGTGILFAAPPGTRRLLLWVLAAASPCWRLRWSFLHRVFKRAPRRPTLSPAGGADDHRAGGVG